MLRARLLKLLEVRDAYTDLARMTQAGKATLFLDIGCHHGSTIERMIDAGITTPIHGFDPIRENLLHARQRLAAYPEVELHELALSDRSGEITFHVNRNVQTSSLLENDIGNLEAFPDQVAEVEARTVRTETLDEWLASHHLSNERIVIKSDIQGAEELLVQGSPKAFSKQVICFYGEVMLAPMYKNQASLESLNRRLDAFGLTLHYVYPCLLDSEGRAVQCDAIWVRKDLLKEIIRR